MFELNIRDRKKELEWILKQISYESNLECKVVSNLDNIFVYILQVSVVSRNLTQVYLWFYTYQELILATVDLHDTLDNPLS